ncbi:MAG: VIT family protein [Lactobacillaceae bacterium]|jgi:VIT1/CCC1 family predicted Fe2+/Mn2+ transporter|nr:VIT family protein [Lactobacillaceae bacterium]
MQAEAQVKIKKTKTMEESLNVIRAGVLGSNDGVLTVVGVLFSVGAVTSNPFTILIAGVADLFACALSMASGEYASVSSQADAEKVVVDLETQRLVVNRSSVEADLRDFYLSRGVTAETSQKIAEALMEKEPLEAILATKYDVQLGHYVSPWAAAFSSMICASLAGALPLLAMILIPGSAGVLLTILATAIASALIGFASAKMGHGFPKKAVVRNVIIAMLTIMIHYGIGRLF